MANCLICCMPNGSCVSYTCTGGFPPGSNCNPQISACAAAGGCFVTNFSWPDCTNACTASEPPFSFFPRCDTVGCCHYLDGRPQFPSLQGGCCQLDQVWYSTPCDPGFNIMVDMFPMRRRA